MRGFRWQPGFRSGRLAMRPIYSFDRTDPVFAWRSPMDSEDLKTFLAIRDAGGFSRAAEILNRSQPAISRRIAVLENEIGVPLFERASGGVVLSQAGQVLVP